jgi:hypothetical protein
MARTLTEIYMAAKEARNQYLQLTEFENSSKMSVLDAFTWTTSVSIWAFENLLDVFKVDLARDLQNRINGTPAYYANALLKYQSGDELEMNEEGTAFMYPTIDETKQVVTKASYAEYPQEGFFDKRVVMKVATGTPGAYQKIGDDELLAIRKYMAQITFAGTNVSVVSRKGDILIPRVTVYHDGAASTEEVYASIEKALNEFVANVAFDGAVYVQKVVDAIQKAEHVVDVYIDNNASEAQGIFVVQYDDDNHLIATESGYESRVDRMFTPNSGFITQSTRIGEEAGLQTWSEAIVLKQEGE